MLLLCFGFPSARPGENTARVCVNERNRAEAPGDKAGDGVIAVEAQGVLPSPLRPPGDTRSGVFRHHFPKKRGRCPAANANSNKQQSGHLALALRLRLVGGNLFKQGGGGGGVKELFNTRQYAALVPNLLTRC